jgi:heme-degrading monooxygenase HmoA
MYSRVTLLEIDTLRVSVHEATEVFKKAVLPGLREQEGYEGVVVLATPEGKGMIITVWESEEAVAKSAGFSAEVLEEHVALYRAPPGREYYEVAFAEMPGVTVG